MKYEVVFYADEKDTTLVETTDLEMAKTLVKGYARKFNMPPTRPYDKDPMIGVLLSYSRMNGCRIEVSIGIVMKED